MLNACLILDGFCLFSGLNFYSFSYKGELKFNIAVHERVLETKEEAKTFADSVVDHILEMSRRCSCLKKATFLIA